MEAILKCMLLIFKGVIVDALKSVLITSSQSIIFGMCFTIEGESDYRDIASVMRSSGVSLLTDDRKALLCVSVCVSVAPPGRAGRSFS